MAVRADAETVAADMRPPDFRKGLKTLRQIKAKKDRASGINGEIAQIYATVEGYKVNKKAAKVFLALDGMEMPERNDILRSLQGLIDVAEWDKDISDLVDSAENNVINLKLGGEADVDESEGEEDDDLDLEESDAQDGVDEAVAEIQKPRGPQHDAITSDKADQVVKGIGAPKPTPLDALRASKAKFANGGRDAPMQPPPYTGDNSDLNPGGTAH